MSQEYNPFQSGSAPGFTPDKPKRRFAFDMPGLFSIPLAVTGYLLPVATTLASDFSRASVWQDVFFMGANSILGVFVIAFAFIVAGSGFVYRIIRRESLLCISTVSVIVQLSVPFVAVLIGYLFFNSLA